MSELDKFIADMDTVELTPIQSQVLDEKILELL